MLQYMNKVMVSKEKLPKLSSLSAWLHDFATSSDCLICILSLGRLHIYVITEANSGFACYEVRSQYLWKTGEG